MSTHWTAQQLLIDARPLANQIPRYNPRPAGVIREGSATQLVLAWLKVHKGWATHHQIRTSVGRSSRAVDFGLRYLRALDLIEHTLDESRNSRYMRYRVKP